MTSSDGSATESAIDPVQLLIMANRIDGIVRDMTNTAIWTTRSATLAARDLSTSISTADHELFVAPEGLPVHVYGSGLICEAMAESAPEAPAAEPDALPATGSGGLADGAGWGSAAGNPLAIAGGFTLLALLAGIGLRARRSRQS